MKFNLNVAAMCAAVSLAAAAPLSAQTTVFDNLPGTLPPNVLSQCLQCQQLNSLGQVITGTQGGTISSFSFILSSFATEANYPTFGSSFTVPITLDIYDVSGNAIVGSSVYSMTSDVDVAFRPAEDPTCPFSSGQFGYSVGGSCYNGAAQLVTFNPVGLTVGSQFGYTLAFSTQNFGPAPTGTSTPTNSLNFGVDDNGAPAIGTVDGFAYDGAGNGGLTTYDVNNDGPIGDNSLTLYSRVDITTATPEPASLVLLGTGLVGIAGFARRRRKSQAL